MIATFFKNGKDLLMECQRQTVHPPQVLLASFDRIKGSEQGTKKYVSIGPV